MTVRTTTQRSSVTRRIRARLFRRCLFRFRRQRTRRSRSATRALDHRGGRANAARRFRSLGRHALETAWDGIRRLQGRLAARLRAELERYVPATRGKIDYAELSTPLSTRHFSNYEQGEIYGYAAVPARFRARPLGARTSIRDLYLTGQDAGTARRNGSALRRSHHGIPGARPQPGEQSDPALKPFAVTCVRTCRK